MRALNLAGRVLLALGVVVLLFTAYQLWGTGLGEQHSQSLLRAKLDRELPPGAAEQASRLAGTLPHRHGTSTGSKRSDRPPSATTFPPGAAASPPSMAPTIPAPAPGQPVGEIVIPSIGLSQVVVEGVAETDLRMGPGHYPGTPLPGQQGNAAIAGHRTTYAHPFYSLDAVAPGDDIVLTTPQGEFVYTAVDQQVVPPDDVSVIDDTTTPTLTLTTCNPRYSASTRLIVHAVLARSHLFGSPGGGPGPGTGASTGHGARAPVATTGGLAGTAGGGGWVAAAGWGALTVVVAVGIALLVGRSKKWRRRGLRWAIELPGTVA
ncbi:MAG: class E sortase, partial [Acidimicrobiales bacterium]